MNKKKFLISLLLLVSALLLVGCVKSQDQLPNTYDLGGSIPELFLDSNSLDIPIYNKTTYTKSIILDTYSGYNGYLIDNKYQIVFKETLGVKKYGLYSVLDDQELLPPIYTSISPIYTYYSHFDLHQNVGVLYLVLYDSIQDYWGLYSVEEKQFSVAMGDYSGIDINVASSDYINTEVVTTFGTLGSPSVKTYRTILTEDLDNLVFTRTELNKEDMQIFEPQKFRFHNVEELKEFTYDMEMHSIIGYKNGNKVFNVARPQAQYNNNFFIGKYFFMQSFTEVSFDSKENDIYDAGEKYVSNLFRIDLTTGEIKLYKNFGYLILNMFGQKNSEGKTSYIIADVNKIENKALLQAHTILFDLDLGLIVDLTLKNYDATYYKVGEDRFYVSDGRVVNGQFETILDYSAYQNRYLIPEYNLLAIKENNLYGLFNFKGEIIAPIVYNLPFNFYAGYVYNHISGGSRYFISPSGLRQEIVDTSFFYLEDGIVGYYGTASNTYKNYLGVQLFTLADDEFIYLTDYIVDKKGMTIGIMYITKDFSTDEERMLIIK